MYITILTEKNFPKVSKVQKKFDVPRAVNTHTGNLEMVEFFGKEGVFRGFGKNTKVAFKKAKKALKKYYS